MRGHLLPRHADRHIIVGGIARAVGEGHGDGVLPRLVRVKVPLPRHGGVGVMVVAVADDLIEIAVVAHLDRQPVHPQVRLPV